jgi:hypothetical protein
LKLSVIGEIGVVTIVSVLPIVGPLPALGVLGEELQAAVPSARTATAAMLPESLRFMSSKLHRVPGRPRRPVVK